MRTCIRCTELILPISPYKYKSKPLKKVSLISFSAIVDLLSTSSSPSLHKTKKTTAMIPLGLKNLAGTNLDAPINNILSVRSSPSPSPTEERVINDAPEDETEEDVEGEEEEEEEEEDTCWAAYGRRGKVGGRGLPPPIPRQRLLQRTYAGDGRLVIREVVGKCHVYFRARRRGGRLTLRPVEYFASACALKRENEESEELTGAVRDTAEEEEGSTVPESSEPLDLFAADDPTVEVSSASRGEGCFVVNERSNPLMQIFAHEQFPHGAWLGRELETCENLLLHAPGLCTRVFKTRPPSFKMV